MGGIGRRHALAANPIFAADPIYPGRMKVLTASNINLPSCTEIATSSILLFPKNAQGSPNPLLSALLSSSLRILLILPGC